jgi:hypothetical protein
MALEHGDEAADAAFERLLVQSARADGPPDGAAGAAWGRFSVGARQLASSAERGGGLLRSAQSGALKWLLLGALGGSVLTAASMSWLARTDDATAAPVGPRRSELPVQGVEARAATSSPSPSAEPGAASASPRLSPPVPAAAPVHRSDERARKAPGHRRANRTSFSLDAEVSALDAARTALSAGQVQRALGLLAQYRTDFPNGELARDAEVFEIEALLADGARAQAERVSDQFLARYPDDPHAARIRALLAR